MFEFYTNNTFEGQNSLNWIPIIIQLCTFAVAAYAVYTARESLNGVSRTQSVQSHMNLITLENEVIKNSENLRMASSKYKKTTDTDENATKLELALLSDAVDNASVLYISSADKLASFINADYLRKQFQKKEWKTEYKALFDNARTYFNEGSYGDMAISKESQMIRNITILLELWNKENLENLEKISENTETSTIINSLPNI